MNYYAHSKENTSMENWQLLKDHLQNTANLSKRNANTSFKMIAYYTGLLHDYGKYCKSFQEKLKGKNIKVEHSIYGARFIERLCTQKMTLLIAYLMEYVIAGHHSGIPDFGTRFDSEEDASLEGRMKRKIEPIESNEIDMLLDKENFFIMINDFLQILKKKSTTADNAFYYYMFSVRYLFSLLTDSDYLDTERYMTNYERKPFVANFDECILQMDKVIGTFRDDSLVNKARRNLQEQAILNLKIDSSIYLLNMPTGSGKTICSMKIALSLLKKHNKKRIIYIIPYTSIIEQTAMVFEKMFPNTKILQHYSNFIFDEQDEDEDSQYIKNCENWDSEIIITTNVQFFESIYSNKSSRLRKFHNMENSILVFDEMHMLPIKYFEPCMVAIDQLTKNYGTIALFLTATMPDFPQLVKKYCHLDIMMQPLITNKESFKQFNNCTFVYLKECTDDKIVMLAEKSTSSLIIVNSKSKALDIFKKCPTDSFYLSTNITPKDRKSIIKQIEERLKNNLKTIVVSTSLIEAGVDLDFETVFRELAGIDNILQAAGRCNREGKRKSAITYIFKSDKKIDGEIAVKQQITENILISKDINDLRNEKNIQDYYCAYYDNYQIVIQNYSLIKHMNSSCFFSFDYATYSESFHFIHDSTISIFIPTKENQELYRKIVAGEFINQSQISPYCASVQENIVKKLLSEGAVIDYHGIYCLENADYYDEKIGLKNENDEIYIIN